MTGHTANKHKVCEVFREIVGLGVYDRGVMPRTYASLINQCSDLVETIATPSPYPPAYIFLIHLTK